MAAVGTVQNRSEMHGVMTSIAVIHSLTYRVGTIGGWSVSFSEHLLHPSRDSSSSWEYE